MNTRKIVIDFTITAMQAHEYLATLQDTADAPLPSFEAFSERLAKIKFRVVSNPVTHEVAAYWQDTDDVGDPMWRPLRSDGCGVAPHLGVIMGVGVRFEAALVLAMAFQRLAEHAHGHSVCKEYKGGTMQFMLDSDTSYCTGR